MDDQPDEMVQLRDLVRQFALKRDWDQFHTPKNLAISISIEAGELLEAFQWLNSGEEPELTTARMENIRHEVADIFLYLIRLADKFDMDLICAAREKLIINDAKYPAETVRGDARKYNEY